MRKARITNQIALLVVLGVFLLSGCMTDNRKWKYFYPDGYIGWARINFKKDAAMPPFEDGAYIFKFTQTGEVDASTEVKKGTGHYPTIEFYYYTDDMQYKRIWPTSAGSVNKQKLEDIERQDYEESQSYQFVGTYEEYEIYRDQFRDKDGDERIGLIKKERLQLQ